MKHWQHTSETSETLENIRFEQTLSGGWVGEALHSKIWR
jgi:hypothetical protein